MSRRRSLLLGSSASLLSFTFIYFATLSDAGSSYGTNGYGYGQKVQPAQPTYVYRPMPLPSFAQYGPAYGFGQGHGQFQPGVFRPVFHDVYQAVKVGFDTNRSPIVYSHLRYVPRLPPPVYGDLGALSQTPTITEEFSTNNAPPDSTTTSPDDDGDGDGEGEGGSSSSHAGDSDYDGGSEVSQYQYGPYNNNTNDDDGDDNSNSSTTSRPSTTTTTTTSATTSTTRTSTTTARTTTARTTTEANQPSPPTTPGPTALPDELPYNGFGNELNGDYNYKDVAPKKYGSGRYGHYDDDDDDQDLKSTTESAIDDFNSNENHNDNDNNFPTEQRDNFATEIEPSSSNVDDSSPAADNLVESPGDSDPKINEIKIKRPNIKKYLLPENELDDASGGGRAVYGYKGVNRKVYGRRRRPAYSSADNDNDYAQDQTIYRDDYGKDQDQNGKKLRYGEESKATDITSSAIDVPGEKILTPTEEVEEVRPFSATRPPTPTTTEKSVSGKDALADFSNDNNNQNHVRALYDGRRNRRRKQKPLQSEVVIEVQTSTPAAAALSARALLPDVADEEGGDVEHEETEVYIPRRERLTPEQQRERDVQNQLHAEFNVPQQIVQPYKTISQPPTEQAARSSSTVEQLFGVPPGNVIVSEQPPELAPAISSLRDGRPRRTKLQRRTAMAL